MSDLSGPVGSASTRLLVIRGGSGSGKSTVAAAIRDARPERSVAVIGQDVMRRQVLGTGDDVGGRATALIDLTTRFALDRGFDVVVEGILNADWYTETLLGLIDDHRGVSRCYLYDLTFDETVRRHGTKPVADVFGVAELQKWWRGCRPVSGMEEARITESDDLEGTIARVMDDCWPSL